MIGNPMVYPWVDIWGYFLPPLFSCPESSARLICTSWAWDVIILWRLIDF